MGVCSSAIREMGTLCVWHWCCSNNALLLVCACCVLQSVNGAHNAWVCALLKVQSSSAGGQSGVLVSGCRSGMVKLWQLGTCAPNGEAV